LLNVNKFYSPGQRNQCYLFCIRRKFVQCGKYFRSHAVPPYTSFTVYNYVVTTTNWIQLRGKLLESYIGEKLVFTVLQGFRVSEVRMTDKGHFYEDLTSRSADHEVPREGFGETGSETLQ
jgi:hypothetical protein